MTGLWLLAAHGAAPERFVQDRLVIGLWVPPQGDTHLRSRYQELAAANFNLVVGTSGTNSALQLELCQELGLRLLVPASGPPEQWPDHAACWGYLLTDEPNARDFPTLARQVATLHQVRPGRLGYINLFPNYASTAQLGSPTYDEHVATFMREVKPDVLSMDHYPLMRPEGDTREAYRANLATLRKHSQAAKIPFWNYFYSMPFNDRLDPTEAQIRWQINASLAYGAKGVLYFCYWTPGKGGGGAGEFPKGGALLTAEGLKTRHYDEARRINGELKNLGPTLMKLNSTGIQRVKTGAGQTSLAANGPIRSITGVPGDPPGEFLIGEFQHEDGRRAVWVVNDNYAYTAWPTVEFNAPVQNVLEMDPASGAAIPLNDDSPELKGVQLSFSAGGARLFLLPPLP